MKMEWIHAPSSWGTDIRCRMIRQDRSRSLAQSLGMLRVVVSKLDEFLQRDDAGSEGQA
ncbi:hypothetical protein HGI30_20115 [Paenibacillus albicereus]|uniref:Uncharacterized protein n=1 Tax=Paenibacillus albicereus TaxID=2726185 RepID=A0A6H2H2P7_9BACL|nr:hypothetical protein [Paenibacillus albicereus]QJC53608.1 hypothetical protein HGI30_20115 [Paenibacillus albicereus]